MKRVCCYCKLVFGEKEPFDDQSESHGICQICFPIVMADHEIQIEKEKMKRKKKTGGDST